MDEIKKNLLFYIRREGSNVMNMIYWWKKNKAINYIHAISRYLNKYAKYKRLYIGYTSFLKDKDLNNIMRDKITISDKQNTYFNTYNSWKIKIERE